jgi:hypothetical protein
MTTYFYNYSNPSSKVDMSLQLDTLSWFQTNQSVLLLLNTVCLMEKQQISIAYYTQ